MRFWLKRRHPARARGGAVLAVVAALGVFGPTPAAADPGQQGTLDRVVIVMRHGVRPPTRAMPLPDGMTARIWPSWPVPPGWLTPHGEAAVALAAQFDAQRYAPLVPSGCPTAAQVRFVADTDQRTLRTAQVYADTLFAGCQVPVENVGAGTRDPRFSPFDGPDVIDPALAVAAITAALPDGGTAAIDRANHDRLARLDAVLGCCRPPACAPGQATCHLTDLPLTIAAGKGRARVTGGLMIAASLAQTLLLEYAEGKPMGDVGWGAVSAADITDLSNLHALDFALTDRPPAIARAGARALLQTVAAALQDQTGAKFTVLVGHDANLALIGGALGLHWQARGFGADDPAPGGALMFELWHDRAGTPQVRVRYRSPSLDAIRMLQLLSAGDTQALAFRACAAGGSCSIGKFAALVDAMGAR